ncbi:PAS domain S-box protein [Actinoplanes sp. LDG1-06]|uniref:histidine kinase n=1 Tax=Paractinoplanes ovalisporus TaxID=2810368 RepID=A0ABS2AIU9_9ACTN|nr:ATP-binding protein [Actinoplanes ovalisporus]MBM2619747.1 PAS domain S-box protein [Actinoplanes ovalisporus]
MDDEFRIPAQPGRQMAEAEGVGPTAGATGADGRLTDAARLSRLRETGMLDGAAYPSLDRLARAAAHQLRASTAVVSLVGSDRRVVVGHTGSVPGHTFCTLVVDTDAALMISDARTDDRVTGHPAVGDGVIAYAGFPIRSPDGYPLGAFGVLDDRPRDWEPRDLLLVEDLAAAAETEIALRGHGRELAATATRLRGMLDNAPDAHVAIDVYGVVTGWNTSAEQLFGFSAAEAVGRPVADLVIPERFVAAHAAGLARLHSGGPSTMVGRRVELVARHRHGREFPVEMSLLQVEGGFHAFLHDISDRQSERRQLEHERAFLQALLDSLDTGVGACDEDGRLTLFNQALRDIHGRGVSEDLPPEDWSRAYDMFGPDGRTPLAAEEIPLAQAYGGKRVDHAEMVIRRDGGPERRFQVNARPLETPDGRRLGAVVAMHDITEQRRTETFRELRLAVARGLADAHSAGEAADRTVAAVGAGMGWALGEFWQADDLSDTIIRVGSWAAPGHGLTPRPPLVRRGVGIAGHVWATGAEVWIPEVLDDPRTVLRATQIRAAGLHSAIGVPVRSDEKILGVLLFFTAVPVEPDPEVLDLLDGVCAHLGRHMERRRAEELALNLAATQARLAASREEMVGMVSHELRNPLGAIRSYSETLLDDPQLSAEQRRLAEVIDRRSAHMQHLVDDLLDLARLEAGQMHIDPQPISAARLVREAVQAQQSAADAKGLTLTLEVPRHLPVHADPVRLRQVLDNLVTNAVKYTPTGGTVSVTAHLTADEEGDAVIAVSDTGIGIPADEYDRLFDRFFRASNAVRNGTKGTGLGLAITKAIVDAHGGSVSATPVPAGGSVFAVTLPVAAG